MTTYSESCKWCNYTIYLDDFITPEGIGDAEAFSEEQKHHLSLCKIKALQGKESE
jgi:hypothetical protein